MKRLKQIRFPLQGVRGPGVPFGPGYPLIRLQALGAGPVSAVIPNAKCPPLVMLNIVKHLIADMHVVDCKVRE